MPAEILLGTLGQHAQVVTDGREIQYLLTGEVRNAKPAAQVEEANRAGRLRSELERQFVRLRCASQMDSAFRFWEPANR
jgi:hypothetical protein